MELLVTLSALYALACVMWLPKGCCLLQRPLRRQRAFEGGGWRLAHPWPAARIWLGSRTSERLWSVAPDAVQGAVEIRRRGLLSAGRRLLDTSDEDDAARMRALLEARASDEERGRRLLEEALATSFDLKAARTRRAGVDGALRWLDVLCSAEFLLLFAVLPGFAVAIDPEVALYYIAPGTLALHGASGIALLFAHRRLLPESGERFEVISSALLYPPSMLRAPAALRMRALSDLHPGTLAATVLPPESAEAALRRELARIRYGRAMARSSRPAEDARDLEARILALAREAGLDDARLARAPERCDTLAESYCPICMSEYRRAEGECGDCRARLQSFGGASC